MAFALLRFSEFCNTITFSVATIVAGAWHSDLDEVFSKPCGKSCFFIVMHHTGDSKSKWTGTDGVQRTWNSKSQFVNVYMHIIDGKNPVVFNRACHSISECLFAQKSYWQFLKFNLLSASVVSPVSLAELHSSMKQQCAEGELGAGYLQRPDQLLQSRYTSSFVYNHSFSMGATLVLAGILEAAGVDLRAGTEHIMLQLKRATLPAVDRGYVSSNLAFAAAHAVFQTEAMQCEYADLANACPVACLLRNFTMFGSDVAHNVETELQSAEFGRVYVKAIAIAISQAGSNKNPAAFGYITTNPDAAFGRCALRKLHVVGPLCLLEMVPDAGSPSWDTEWVEISSGNRALDGEGQTPCIVQYMDTIIVTGRRHDHQPWRLVGACWRYQYVISNKHKKFGKIQGITFMVRSSSLAAVLTDNAALWLEKIMVVKTGSGLRSGSRWSGAAMKQPALFLRMFGAMRQAGIKKNLGYISGKVCVVLLLVCGLFPFVVFLFVVLFCVFFVMVLCHTVLL